MGEWEIEIKKKLDNRFYILVSMKMGKLQEKLDNHSFGRIRALLQRTSDKKLREHTHTHTNAISLLSPSASFSFFPPQNCQLTARIDGRRQKVSQAPSLHDVSNEFRSGPDSPHPLLIYFFSLFFKKRKRTRQLSQFRPPPSSQPIFASPDVSRERESVRKAALPDDAKRN